jgi:hypothetical protein
LHWKSAQIILEEYDKAQNQRSAQASHPVYKETAKRQERTADDPWVRFDGWWKQAKSNPTIL